MERALQEITGRLREVRELIETSACELEEDIDIFEQRAWKLARLWDAPHRNVDAEAQAALEDFCSRNLQQAARCATARADVEVPPSEVGAGGIQESDPRETQALATGVGEAVAQPDESGAGLDGEA